VLWFGTATGHDRKKEPWSSGSVDEILILTHFIVLLVLFARCMACYSVYLRVRSYAREGKCACASVCACMCLCVQTHHLCACMPVCPIYVYKTIENLCWAHILLNSRALYESLISSCLWLNKATHLLYMHIKTKTSSTWLHVHLLQYTRGSQPLIDQYPFAEFWLTKSPSVDNKVHRPCVLVYVGLHVHCICICNSV
jgi:hypothetical protein